MKSLFNRLLGFFFVYFFFIGQFINPGLFGDELKTENLLEIIGNLEKDMKVLECNIRFQKFRVKTEIDEKVNFSASLSKWIGRGEPEGTDKTIHILLEAGTGRIYFKQEGIGPGRVAGSSEIIYSNVKRELGFDGKRRTELMISERDKHVPPTGIINNRPLMVNKELSSHETGLDVFLPFYRGVGLKRYLVSNNVDPCSISGRLGSDGILEVYYKDHQKRRLLIDIKKGGAILSSENFSSISNNVIVWKTENTWVRSEEGYYIPRSAICVAGDSNPLVSQWTFKQVRINHIQPNPEMFRVRFPEGTEVEDRLAGTRYVVSVSTPMGLPRQIGKSLPELKDLGINLSPADTNDKRVLVCFFDMEQRPSRNCILQLSKRAQELKEKDIIIAAIQASKIERVKLDKWIKENNIDFPVGIIEGDQEKTRFNWGVKSLPWLILTDKNHVVIAEGFSLDELDEKVQNR